MISKDFNLNQPFRRSQQKLIWNYLNCIYHQITFKYQILICCSLKTFPASSLPSSKSWMSFKTFWHNFFVWKYSTFWLEVAFTMDWISCKIFLLLSRTFLLLVSKIWYVDLQYLFRLAVVTIASKIKVKIFG